MNQKSIIGKSNRIEEEITPFEELEARILSYKESDVKPNVKPTAPAPSNIESTVISHKNYWTIKNVIIHNVRHTVELLKEPLDNGAMKKNSDWITYSKNSKLANQFNVGDMLTYHALFTQLYKTRSEPQVEEIRSYLEKLLRKSSISTLTNVVYCPKNKSIINHEYDQNNIYTSHLNGSIRSLNHISDICEDYCYVIFGSKDANHIMSEYRDNIESIYKWITNTEYVYINGIDKKTKKITEAITKNVAIHILSKEAIIVNMDSEFGISLGIRIKDITQY
jgi:hypothetical protein